MGPAENGALPMSPWYGTNTETRDHSSEITKECQSVSGCNENCINAAILSGRATGRWSPTNNCNTFIEQVIALCCIK